MANYFTNENPSEVTNTSGNYGIVPGSINPAQIEDGLTDRGAGLGKLGSSMPSPLARLFLFSAALREVNSYEDKEPGKGHIGILNKEIRNNEPTPYHDLVGEMLDMLEFVFQYGDHPDFHVVTWNVDDDCAALEKSPNGAHKQLASALRSAFGYGVLAKQPDIYLFKWKDTIIGGTSPISLVYTSANLRRDLKNMGETFTGNAADVLFDENFFPLHKRSKEFREYLYRLYYTDLQRLPKGSPLEQLATYIQHSASNYDKQLNNDVIADPAAWHNVKKLSSQGAMVIVAGVQLRVSNHTVVINPSTSDYIIAPTTGAQKRPMVLTKHGVSGLVYAAGRVWNAITDCIPSALSPNIDERDLPGFVGVKYPYLTVDDFFEDKVIEVSYKINKEKFFTGCKKDLTILLPLKKVFFEYFNLSDLVDGSGNYTNMLTVKHDDQRMTMAIDLKIPLVNGKSIILHKSYDLSDGSSQKVNCYDGARTFDFAIFPFYRLEPNMGKNVYNVMVGATVDGVSMEFYEQTDVGISTVESEKKKRTPKEDGKSPISTDHIRVKGAFSFSELTIDGTSALIIPLFTKVNSDPERAANEFVFSIDFGTTNTHVAYAQIQPGNSIGKANVEQFAYGDADAQMVMFNDKSGVAEFGTFTTAVKRELVPTEIGVKGKVAVKFPMRTATYQVVGKPTRLDMFFHTNIGFNYGEDISRSKEYKTNIKWERFDPLAQDRMKAFFAQMLWMMKNKSVLNDGSDKFKLMVTYPISMRESDLNRFKAAWETAKKEVHCDVDILYGTESVAPYYSYLANLLFGEPYANMDIGGGTTDILYVNPVNNDNHVFSAFFAANDLWNDGIDKVNQANKDNGFITWYKKKHLPNLGNDKAQVQDVIKKYLSRVWGASILSSSVRLIKTLPTLSPRCSSMQEMFLTIAN